MANFSDIVRYQKSQGKGALGALTSAVGQASLQKIDPRNYLFNRRGTFATLFPGLKGYQARTSGDKVSSGGVSGGFSSGQVDLITQKLDIISIDTKITARNSLALPAMAKQMNIMQKNTAKMVSLLGGTPSSKADSFFQSSKFRENAYEAQFNKGRPSPVGQKPGEKQSWFSGLMAGGLMGLISGLMSALVKGGLIAGALAALGAAVEKFFKDPQFREKVFNMIKDFFKSDFGKALMVGAATVVAVFASFRLALLALEAVVLKIAARMGTAFGIPSGAPGGKGNKGGKTKPRGGGRFGWSIPLLLGLPFVNDIVGGDSSGTPEIPQMPGAVPDGTTPSTPASNVSSGPNKTNIAVNSAVAGIAGVDAVTRMAALSTPKVAGYNMAAKRFVDASGTFVSAKNLPKGDMLKKFIDFAAKAASKGWISKIGGKLAVRLGAAVATKAVAFIGGLAVPGPGWLVSAASMAMLAYDAYTIYDAIFGDNGILQELEKEETAKAPPAPQSTVPTVPTTSNTPSQVPTLPSNTSSSTNGGGGSTVSPSSVKLVQIKSKTGATASVNAEYAPKFQALIDYLDSINYPIKSIQGYDDRNVRGMNVKSIHAYGAAIDINPQSNPMLNGKLVTDLPPDAIEYAKKLGLGWGGDWSSRKDPMHFSAAQTEGGTLFANAGGRPPVLMAGSNNGGHKISNQSIQVADARSPVTSGGSTNVVVQNQQGNKQQSAPEPMQDLKIYDSDLAKFLMREIVV